MATQREVRVLVWGDTSVGKTTLLATFLFQGELRDRWLDRQRSAKLAGYRELIEVWKRIERGLPTTPTVEELTVRVVATNGSEVEFVDVVGGETTRLPADYEADGVLFLIDLNRLTTGNGMLSLQMAEATGLAQGKPAGLVVMKADQVLSKHDPAWDAGRGWWESHLPTEDLTATQLRLLRSFDDRVWPVSAFGYDGILPAVLWSEFGHFLPHRTSPRNVDQPFASILDRLGLLP